MSINDRIDKQTYGICSVSVTSPVNDARQTALVAILLYCWESQNFRLIFFPEFMTRDKNEFLEYPGITKQYITIHYSIPLPLMKLSNCIKVNIIQDAYNTSIVCINTN